VILRDRQLERTPRRQQRHLGRDVGDIVAVDTDEFPPLQFAVEPAHARHELRTALLAPRRHLRPLAYPEGMGVHEHVDRRQQ
jgi:hypothetical protein